MANVSLLNTDAGISGKTVDLLESDQTITGLKTFSRGAAAPFAVAVGSTKVANLDVDKLDGFDWSSLGTDLLFTDASFDIGKSGATRPRDLFLSRNAVIGGTLGVTGVVTASAGITFGDQTLAAYKENTWTPIIVSTGGGTATYSSQLGRYIKKGKDVTVWGDVTLATLGTLAAGNARIGGLPFTSNNVLSMPGVVGYFAAMTTSVITFYIHQVSNSTFIDMYFRATAGTSAAQMSISDLSTTTRLMFTCSYEAAA